MLTEWQIDVLLNYTVFFSLLWFGKVFIYNLNSLNVVYTIKYIQNWKPKKYLVTI